MRFRCSVPFGFYRCVKLRHYAIYDLRHIDVTYSNAMVILIRFHDLCLTFSWHEDEALTRRMSAEYSDITGLLLPLALA